MTVHGFDYFRTAFISAGITESFGGSIASIGNGAPAYAPIRIAAAAVLGGTTSQISGGTFANGAVTAAFVQAFNHENRMKKAQRLRAQRLLNEKSGFFVQAGIVVNKSALVGGASGELGIYLGTRENGSIEMGIYFTGSSGLQTPSAGVDGGLIFAISPDMAVNHLSGTSIYVQGGLDTVIDIQVAIETVVDKGHIYNFSITGGPEVSAALVASGGSGVSYTETIPLVGENSIFN